MFSTQNVKFRLARGNYHVKILLKSVMITITLTVCMKIMITNTSARPMCKASTLIFCRYVWYPPPYQKAWLRHWWAPDRKINHEPLRSLPPPPPQSKTVSDAPGVSFSWKGENLRNLCSTVPHILAEYHLRGRHTRNYQQQKKNIITLDCII